MELVCIVCPNSCKMNNDDGVITGFKCPRGKKFFEDELTCPKRTVCTTVATSFADMPVLPCRTSADIPKDRIFELMDLVKTLRVDRRLGRGEIIVKNVLGTGVDLISTADMSE